MVTPDTCGVTVMRGWRPERMLGRQRLLREDVERGAAELAGIEQREQVVLDQVRAARKVDEVRAVGEALEVLAPQDADRSRPSAAAR